MGPKDWLFLVLVVVSAHGTYAATRVQLKKAAALFKKKCLTKIDVAEELVRDIEQGTFIEDRNVMCYMGCIYQMAQCVKNNKWSYEATVKQVELLYPPEMKYRMKKTLENCRDVPKRHKDLCEQAYWMAKCIYEDDPENFYFA